MPYRCNYPRHGAELIDDALRYKPITLRIVREFALRYRPWRGPVDLRQLKFQWLHEQLCRIYGRRTQLVFNTHNGPSCRSCYVSITDAIILRGRLSVLTYLHEFAHALGRDERAACRWSLNLFKRCFPVSFGRATFVGHMLIRGRSSSGSAAPGCPGRIDGPAGPQRK